MNVCDHLWRPRMVSEPKVINKTQPNPRVPYPTNQWDSKTIIVNNPPLVINNSVTSHNKKHTTHKKNVPPDCTQYKAPGKELHTSARLHTLQTQLLNTRQTQGGQLQQRLFQTRQKHKTQGTDELKTDRLWPTPCHSCSFTLGSSSSGDSNNGTDTHTQVEKILLVVKSPWEI